MVYCISDIHGEYKRYMDMLEYINFSDTDTLYVLGDVIDRHSDGVDILLDLMQRPNAQLLLGNHELMLWHTLGPDNKIGARQLWQQNGGSSTRRELLYHRTIEERNAILAFIRDLPEWVDIEVNGCNFHLVHGYPGETQDVRLWERPTPNVEAPIPNTTVIVGHTPTVYLNGDNDESLRIWHGKGIIGIDCGCGNESDLQRLACLRLDDMKEFYV